MEFRETRVQALWGASHGDRNASSLEARAINWAAVPPSSRLAIAPVGMPEPCNFWKSRSNSGKNHVNLAASGKPCRKFACSMHARVHAVPENYQQLCSRATIVGPSLSCADARCERYKATFILKLNNLYRSADGGAWVPRHIVARKRSPAADLSPLQSMHGCLGTGR